MWARFLCLFKDMCRMYSLTFLVPYSKNGITSDYYDVIMLLIGLLLVDDRDVITRNNINLYIYLPKLGSFTTSIPICLRNNSNTFLLSIHHFLHSVFYLTVCYSVSIFTLYAHSTHTKCSPTHIFYDHI